MFARRQSPNWTIWLVVLTVSLPWRTAWNCECARGLSSHSQLTAAVTPAASTQAGSHHCCGRPSDSAGQSHHQACCGPSCTCPSRRSSGDIQCGCIGDHVPPPPPPDTGQVRTERVASFCVDVVCSTFSPRIRTTQRVDSWALGSVDTAPKRCVTLCRFLL